jgi:hypothetical protein
MSKRPHFLPKTPTFSFRIKIIYQNAPLFFAKKARLIKKNMLKRVMSCSSRFV